MAQKLSFKNNSVSGVHGVANPAMKGISPYLTSVGGHVGIRTGQVQGVPDFSHNTISMDEPMRIGRFIGKWLRVPTFLPPEMIDYWLYFLEDKIMEVNGLSDNELQNIERTIGAVGRTESYAGTYKETNNKFTLKIPEVKGSPVRKLLKYYISGISDSTTGIAHFHGQSHLRFSKVNYGGDFLYVMLGPSMRPDDIEFACMWLNAFPNKDWIQQFNSGTIGDAGTPLDMEIEFSGTYVQNNVVDRLAMIMTEVVGLYKDTVEDVILPEYIYEKYLGGVTPELRKMHGGNIQSKIANLFDRLTDINQDKPTESRSLSHSPLDAQIEGVTDAFKIVKDRYNSAAREPVGINVRPGSPLYIEGEYNDQIGVVDGNPAQVGAIEETIIGTTGLPSGSA